MNRLANKRVWTCAVLLASAAAVLAEPPAATNGVSATATNLASNQSQEMREAMIKQRLQHDMFRPYNPAQDSSLNGLTYIPSSQPTLTAEQAQKLKEIIDKENYWMFATSDDTSKDSKGEKGEKVLGDSGASDYENEAPAALKQFFDRSSRNRLAAGNTNNLTARDRELSRRDSFTGGSSKEQIITTENRTAGNSFDSPANNIVGRLFQSPAARDAVRDAGGIGGNGLFSDTFTPQADAERELRVIDDQHRQAFNDILNSASSKSVNNYNSLPGISASSPGGGGLFSSQTGGGDSGLGSTFSALNSAGGASSLGASSISPSSPSSQASGIMQFEPIEPHHRGFGY